MQHVGRRESAKWRTATVKSVKRETPTVKSLYLNIENFHGFMPGQHLDILLTAPDGYQAQRSYSISSAPEDMEDTRITVELMEGGEVSPFLHDIVRPGDSFKVRGPIGGPFTWTSDRGGPLLLIGGGSGIAPLISMLLHRNVAGSHCPALLLYSCRNLEEIIFRGELESLEKNDNSFRIVQTLTRGVPKGWTGYSRRVDKEMITETVMNFAGIKHALVCGPTDFVEVVATLLTECDVEDSRIVTERFGPSG